MRPVDPFAGHEKRLYGAALYYTQSAAAHVCHGVVAAAAAAVASKTTRSNEARN